MPRTRQLVKVTWAAANCFNTASEAAMSLNTILLIVLIVFLFGGGGWYWGRGRG